jgi:hypothetical protein
MRILIGVTLWGFCFVYVANDPTGRTKSGSRWPNLYQLSSGLLKGIFNMIQWEKDKVGGKTSTLKPAKTR